MAESKYNNARLNTSRPSCNNSGDGGCEAKMKKLRMLDFAIVDVNLYLDAYPDSTTALEYYRKLIAERERLAASINIECGPLTARDGAISGKWKWTNGPWPWHPDAN